MNKKTSASLPGTVEKIIKSPLATAPDKAQIKVVEADNLYRAIRIDNSLTNENGEEVRLKLGAQVKITVEAKSVTTVLEK
jgi:hypothetical protein